MAGGRPRFKITDQVLAKVETLSAQGLTHDQIATVIGCSLTTLQLKKRQYAQFSDALSRGKDKGIAVITNAMFSKAKSGDNQCMMFYLKNRDSENWKEKTSNEHTGEGGGPIESRLWTTTIVDPDVDKDASN